MYFLFILSKLFILDNFLLQYFYVENQKQNRLIFSRNAISMYFEKIKNTDDFVSVFVIIAGKLNKILLKFHNVFLISRKEFFLVFNLQNLILPLKFSIYEICQY